MITCQQFNPSSHPFPNQSPVAPWLPRTEWPAHWIQPPASANGSAVIVYQLEVTCEAEIEVDLHVTADQRYWLYIDDVRIGRGSERGTTREWYYESYRVRIPAGRHKLRALTWHLCKRPPWAQVSVQPGFLLAASAPYTKLLSTGCADWKTRILDTVEFIDPVDQVGRGIGCGERVHYTGAAWLDAFCAPWQPPRILAPGNNGFLLTSTPSDWILSPATLPAMRSERIKSNSIVHLVDSAPLIIDRSQQLINEARQWTELLLEDQALSIAPQSTRRILIDLRNYHCAYTQITTLGGAGSTLTIAWAERLSTDPKIALAPQDRRQIDGLHFVGVGDSFTLTTSEAGLLEPLWWQAGRFVQITVSTSDEPLTIEQIRFEATGYPLKNESSFASNAPWLDSLIPVAYRTLETCAQETYTDCPYWEQLQYIGDTRIQALLTYLTNRDVRLIEKGIHTFTLTMTGASPFPSSSAPNPGIKILAPFALWWIGMVHDYARWHGNKDFIRKQLPTAWWIVDHFLLDRDQSGLIRSPQGWNYVDSTVFKGGEPLGAEPGGVSGVLNWQLVLALNELANLSTWLEQPERAAYATRLSRELATRCEAAFWNAEQAAIADDRAQTTYSEHSQALALLSRQLSPAVHRQVADTLNASQSLLRAGPYFTHYICEALRQEDRPQALQTRLKAWSQFIDAGFYTFPEEAIVGRSDCHAWSAHPLYHAYASIVGIRPRGFGFEQVEIAPQLGELRQIKLTIPWRNEFISLEIKPAGPDRHSVRIHLPPTLSGEFIWLGQRRLLPAGETCFQQATSL